MDVPDELRGLRQVVAAEDEKPFRHWVIDDLFDGDMLRAAERAFDAHLAEPGWVDYSEPNQVKRTFNKLEKMPDAVRACVYEWNCSTFARQLSDLTGIHGLRPDPALWGAGMHVIGRDGYLRPHLDHSHNPNGLERRLSMIVFLNSIWEPGWNGDLELWSNAGQWPVKSIGVRFNRTVLFESGITAWHGVPIPLACPNGTMRKTIALYYLADSREGIVRRVRAQFVPPFAKPPMIRDGSSASEPDEELDE